MQKAAVDRKPYSGPSDYKRKPAHLGMSVKGQSQSIKENSPLTIHGC